MEIEKILEDDFLKQIYYGEIYFSKESPETPEYNKLIQKMKKLSEIIRNDKKLEAKFMEYCEIRSIKESMETEMQFKLGFKTAVRLIIYGLN